MFEVISPSDEAPAAPTTDAAPLQRARGRARLAVKHDGRVSRIDTLFQEGSAKLRLPKPVSDACEAVVLNTSGGLTGGDRFSVSVKVGDNASADVAGQAFEKIYKSSGGVAEMETELEVGAGARLDWLPQPAILFDRAAMRRRTSVHLASDSTLIAVEGLVFGRAAMGESVETGTVHDGWRVYRDGRLIFADAFSVEGPVADILGGKAVLGDARATATVLCHGPMAAAMLDPVRELLAEAGLPAGASLVADMLVVRLAASSAQALVAGLVPVLTLLRGRDLPRVWFC
ncbi:MAG: urease accessory protein [Hyphomicrobiales bacterium]|nr:MAG: urease accessory protein [Hyphomicrobiales bacterium]